MRRRHFLQQIFSVVAVTIINALYSKQSTAARPATPSASGEFTSGIERLSGGQTFIDSDDIHINLPETAEDGAVVPITISSELEQIQRIQIWVEKNPTPLTATFEFDASVMPYLTARIKMAESSNVMVIAQQGGRLLRRQQWVNVMQGGCGTG